MGEHAYAHVPVMAGRVTALLLPALTGPTPDGRPPVLVDATLGRAGHARILLEAAPELQLIGIDADAAGIEAGRALAAQYPGRVTLAHAFYDRIAEIVADAGHRRDPGGAVRPRGVVAAARRRQPGVLLRPGRAARHAHGPERRADRRAGRQHLPGAGPGAGAGRVRRGASSPAGSPRPSSGSGPASRSPARCGWRRSSRTRSRPPPGAPAATPPSGPSRRSASR